MIKNKEKILKLLNEFNESDQRFEHQGNKYSYEDWDNLRLEVKKNILMLLNEYLSKNIDLASFKKDLDSITKKNNLWGFKGINGLMFFNQLNKTSKNEKELNALLLKLLKLPKDIETAKNNIDELHDYTQKISVDITDKRKSPKPKSIPFFLSYFWQIQDPEKFPIFYTSLELGLQSLDLLESNDSLGSYYEKFYIVNKELKELFQKELNKPISFWFIEHLFWWAYTREDKTKIIEEKNYGKESLGIESYYNYIPPIISNLKELSKNLSSPNEFENSTSILFTMLGFDVIKLGQGKGRTVDIIAKGYPDSGKNYVVLIDCKSRGKEDYKINAGEERTMIEYVTNFRDDYPKNRKDDIYFLLVSSGFNEISDKLLRKIKSETKVDLSYITVDTLLFLLSLKLQKWEIDIGSIKKVFQKQGLITKEHVLEVLSGR